MPETQNIYTVSDNVGCPSGEGKVITEYLKGLFSRLASKVVSFGKPIDWLIVKSDGLEGCYWGSQNFFEERFEKELKKINNKISIIKYNAVGCGGNITNKDIEKLVEEILKEENIKFNYLNEPNLGMGFVGYHLKMPKE